MNKVIGLVGVASLALAACGGEAPDSSETGSLGQDLDPATSVSLQRGLPSDSLRLDPPVTVLRPRIPKVNPLDNIAAALATAVLKCKGSLTANDFRVGNERRLELGFDKCPRDPEQLKEIENLLKIQLYEKAQFAPYLVDHWEKYIVAVEGVECPTWNPVKDDPLGGVVFEINPPTPENVKKYVEDRDKPPTDPNTKPAQSKTNYRWTIEPTKQCQANPRDPSCLVESAAKCSSWATSRFVVNKDSKANEVTTDPQWWWDNTPYYPTPFDPSYGYEHPMAQNGYAPGDVFGAVNRKGELCSVYKAGYILPGSLYEINCDGQGWMCMTMCD